MLLPGNLPTRSAIGGDAQPRRQQQFDVGDLGRRTTAQGVQRFLRSDLQHEDVATGGEPGDRRLLRDLLELRGRRDHARLFEGVAYFLRPPALLDLDDRVAVVGVLHIGEDPR